MKNRVVTGCLGVCLSGMALPGVVQAEPLEVSGFSWVENLAFDGRGNLFVSELNRGEIWRIRPDGSGGYRTELFLEGFVKVLGLAATPDGGEMYANAKLADGSYALIRFDPEVPGGWDLVVPLPKLGNGLVVEQSGLVYTACEGSFFPGDGVVYEIDPSSGTWSEIMNDLWAADGVALDQDALLLYVGEVVSGKIWVYDLASRQNLGFFQGVSGRKLEWVDDFTLSDDGEFIFGADFHHGTIVHFQAGEEDTQEVVYEGFMLPTSVEWGSGPGFHNTSLYVTEGCAFREGATRCRVVEIENAR